MKSDDPLLVELLSPCEQYLLVVEDDGKVAYAYLKRTRETIVGDVWLYNRCPTPQSPEWTTPENIPFANCRDYVKSGGRVTEPVQVEDVAVDWEYEEGSPVAYVYVFGDLYGVVGVGDKPGYARFARKDGPLAKVLKIED